jgi:hypothetical protein
MRAPFSLEQPEPSRYTIRSSVAKHAKEDHAMCLTCGCMDAHLEMGDNNVTYEDLKRAADENGRSVAETIAIMEKTESKDRDSHPKEYATS